MSEKTNSLNRLLHDLRERAKELNCLYEVQELLSTPGVSLERICQGIIAVLPPAWQFPDVCEAEITCGGIEFQTRQFKQTPWLLSADVVVQNETVGRISVCYAEERPPSDEGPFLKEERRLIDTIAQQLGFHILHDRLKQVFREQAQDEKKAKGELTVILDLLKRTDPDLLMVITRKMINHLACSGVKEAERLLERSSLSYHGLAELEGNRPFNGQAASSLLDLSEQVFALAEERLSRQVILDNIEKWSREDRVRFLVDALVDPATSLSQISSAIERYHLVAAQGISLTPSREKWLSVALIRRLLSDQPHFMRVAQQYIGIDDFGALMRRVIFPAGSHGGLGGKGSGLFLAAQILRSATNNRDLLANVRTPKTWYITSDSIFQFMNHNGLEDLIEQKYRDLNQVRQEYPYVMHIFKNSQLPPEIAKGLSLALDDLNDVPLIVRSSSLLEDQTGAAFAGKYKSLFIANRGTREERLAALMDAICEVFASMFGPDPIEYRIRHGLVDCHEEMGILIQEVVGTQVGPYYLPPFAGVAFSNNEFRWSSRIRREDGLVRVVPGLGTRAVDRLSDDYPVLIAPAKPGLRVNTTPDEVLRYSPKRIDVINLEERAFETIDLHSFLTQHGSDLPLANDLISIHESNSIRKPSALGIDFSSQDIVVTFDGLFTRTPLLKQVQAILAMLQQALGYPVDIEFAHDGVNFYLLQCRSQSHSEDSIPAIIPKDSPRQKVLFTANRFVSNGSLTDLTHIVYVDPLRYASLARQDEMVAVGRAVGVLNQHLPKRHFILMGPGRWGSRGDIRLGVSVTYSDINNAAMLIEIARKHKDFVPEPSFGTHFFQDLVESSIRYLPLYPDEPGVLFNEEFLTGQTNLLPQLAPDFARLADVMHVIDVPAATGGEVLQVLMNADSEKAIGLLGAPSTALEREITNTAP
jgi:pyruvate,water dikinase